MLIIANKLPISKLGEMPRLNSLATASSGQCPHSPPATIPEFDIFRW